LEFDGIDDSVGFLHTHLTSQRVGDEQLGRVEMSHDFEVRDLVHRPFPHIPKRLQRKRE
jgi:hypothetical protein